MADREPRQYSSPLRERHAQHTRDVILDAVTELLETRRSDEVTTRQIAETAGVSERTVYRHFPDRNALLAGLTARLSRALEGRGYPVNPPVDTMDELKLGAIRLMAGLEEFHVEARAEALLNADPRRFSPETRATSDLFPRIIGDVLPDVGERDRVRIAAAMRCMVSSQAWLRMREEFGVAGDESGPTVAWVLEAVVEQARRGRLPSVLDDSA